MIKCNECNKEFKTYNDVFCCEICGKKIAVKNGIFLFNPEIKEHEEDFDADYLDFLYKYEKKHFWFTHRNNIIKRVFGMFVNKNSHIIEIGAGTGAVARCLLAAGYKNMAVGEMHINGLEYARTYGIKDLYQFDLLKAPFAEHFETIGLFDVVEHIEYDGLAIENAHRILKDGGHIVLTVPAHQWLWSNIDFNSGHKRRYSKKTLKKLLTTNGFEVLYASYFFSLVLPLLYVRTLLNKKIKPTGSKQNVKNSGLKIHGFSNSVLSAVCKVEFFLSGFVSFGAGGSIIMVAKKQPEARR